MNGKDDDLISLAEKMWNTERKNIKIEIDRNFVVGLLIRKDGDEWKCTVEARSINIISGDQSASINSIGSLNVSLNDAKDFVNSLE